MNRKLLTTTLLAGSLLMAGSPAVVHHHTSSMPLTVSVNAKAKPKNNGNPNIHPNHNRKGNAHHNNKNNSNSNNPNNQYDVSTSKNSGEITLNKPVKAVDAKQANKEVTLPKGTRLAYRKLSDGSILVGNNKYKSSEGPDSSHELLVEDEYKSMFNGKGNKSTKGNNKGQMPASNKAKQKPKNIRQNAATRHPNRVAVFKSGSKGNYKGSLPKTSQKSMSKKTEGMILTPMIIVLGMLIFGGHRFVRSSKRK